MNASAGLTWDARSQGETDELQLWLESLSSGEWNTDEFLRQVLRLEKHDPGLPWDVLTQLEQHYHRELISHELFICAKARLQKHLEGDAEPAQPLQEVPPEPQAGTNDALRAGDLVRGRYRITDILERTSCGTQAEAVDEQRLDVPSVGRKVTICVFDVLPTEEARLKQHYYRLQSLAHPCIQKVLEVDEHQGHLCVTQEWLSGITAHQLLDLNGGHGLPVPVARSLVRAVASGLAYAHAHHVSHGALDASSVVATEGGDIKLRGFAVAGLQTEGDLSVDRLAFANLAYRLMRGATLPDPHLGPRARKATLRQPPGLSTRQWNALRETLLGKQSPTLLAEFAGVGEGPAGRHTLAQVLPAATARTRSPWFVSAAAVAVTLAAVGLLFIDPRGSGVSHASVPAEPNPPAASVGPQATVSRPPERRRRASRPMAVRSIVQPDAPATPTTVPVDSGLARIELIASTVDAPDQEPFARIVVHRLGNLQGAVSFKWWTETGSALVNRDFLGIEPRLEWIPDGARSVELRVPLLTDPSRHESRSFYVKIQGAGSVNAVLGTRTLTQVSIQPGNLPDTTSLHPGASTVAKLP
jgi:hypothetical protein